MTRIFARAEPNLEWLRSAVSIHLSFQRPRSKHSRHRCRASRVVRRPATIRQCHAATGQLTGHGRSPCRGCRECPTRLVPHNLGKHVASFVAVVVTGDAAELAICMRFNPIQSNPFGNVACGNLTETSYRVNRCRFLAGRIRTVDCVDGAVRVAGPPLWKRNDKVVPVVDLAD